MALNAGVPYDSTVENKDANQEALEQVQKATESGPVDAEELLGSEELKRKYREANHPNSSPPPEPQVKKYGLTLAFG